MPRDSSAEDHFLDRFMSTSSFLSAGGKLDKHQMVTVKSCFDICQDHALVSLSRAYYYRILRVREFFRKVYSTLGPVELILCMLSESLTNLSKLDPIVIIPKIRTVFRGGPSNLRQA